METNDVWYRSSFVIFSNKNWVWNIHCLSFVDYLAVVKGLVWQLGQALVAVAIVERWLL